MTEAQGADLLERVGALGVLLGQTVGLLQLCSLLLICLVWFAGVRKW